MGETANSGTLLANVVGEEGGSGACRAEEEVGAEMAKEEEYFVVTRSLGA